MLTATKGNTPIYRNRHTLKEGELNIVGIDPKRGKKLEEDIYRYRKNQDHALVSVLGA